MEDSHHRVSLTRDTNQCVCDITTQSGEARCCFPPKSKLPTLGRGFPCVESALKIPHVQKVNIWSRGSFEERIVFGGTSAASCRKGPQLALRENWAASCRCDSSVQVGCPSLGQSLSRSATNLGSSRDCFFFVVMTLSMCSGKMACKNTLVRSSPRAGIATPLTKKTGNQVVQWEWVVYFRIMYDTAVKEAWKLCWLSMSMLDIPYKNDMKPNLQLHLCTHNYVSSFRTLKSDLMTNQLIGCNS